MSAFLDLWDVTEGNPLARREYEELDARMSEMTETIKKDAARIAELEAKAAVAIEALAIHMDKGVAEPTHYKVKQAQDAVRRIKARALREAAEEIAGHEGGVLNRMADELEPTR